MITNSKNNTYYAILPLKEKELKRINRYLTHVPENEYECLNEDETISHTVIFPDGVSMDIKCCGVQFIEGEGCNNCAWTEAVLFNHRGNEIAHSDVVGDYEGQWDLPDGNGNFYIVNIISKTEYKRWHSVDGKELLPDENLPVFVTYKSYHDGKLISDSSAYYKDGWWYWTDNDEPVAVEITHWRYLPNGPQYVCY